MKDIDLKLAIIRNHISVHDIKITDLAIEAGYARPYLSSIINQSKEANHGILDHLLQTLKIDYLSEKTQIESLNKLSNDIEHALLYNNIECAQNLYQELELINKIPSLIKKDVINRKSFYYSYIQNEPSSIDTPLAKALNHYLMREYEKVVVILNALVCDPHYNNTYKGVFYLYIAQSYLELDCLHSAQTAHHLASSLLVKTRNYQRMIDAELILAKIYTLNKQSQKAFLIYDTLWFYNTLSNKQTKIIKHDCRWTLILSKKQSTFFEDQTLLLENLAIAYLNNLKIDFIDKNQLHDDSDRMFYLLLLSLQKEAISSNLLFEAIDLFKNHHFKHIFLKRIYKSLLLDCLTKKRMYKDAFELK